MDILPGTAIATFDRDGKYRGHAAIYVGQDANGIQVVDHWNPTATRPGKMPSYRVIRFNNPKGDVADQGLLYYVVD